MIYYDVEPEFTYNIEVLINELEKITEISGNVKNAAELTTYAITTRYPGEYDEITKEEYEKAVHIAKDCLEWVENTIRENEKGKP